MDINNNRYVSTGGSRLLLGTVNTYSTISTVPYIFVEVQDLVQSRYVMEGTVSIVVPGTVVLHY
jgi:hypothetical protein